MTTGIISFDPGTTTGVAICYISDNDVTFKVHQLGPEEHHIALEDLITKSLQNVTRSFIVYETFEYRNKARAGLVLDSREYIGIIKGYGYRYGLPVVAQSPAQAKGFVDNTKLKKLNLYSTSFKHANDAMRHLLYFIVNNEEFRFKALNYELLFRQNILELGFK